MSKASAFEKGSAIMVRGKPFIVVEREFVKPGKGGAFVRFRLKDCISGAVLRETFPSEATLESAEIDRRPTQYLYADDTAYFFMDNETYEQFNIPKDGLEDRGKFMVEGESYELTIWNEKPIDILVPTKISFEVLEAPDAVKGNTATGATKVVTLQNGIEVKVPLFIKQGEKIIVNTETGDYVSRDTE